MSDRTGAEYLGLKASSWDLLRGDTSGWPDRAFYREVIERSGEPVLDIGCATGRLLLDYAAGGTRIDGVDASPEMLALCRERADRLGLKPGLFQQWMHELDLPGRYATILVPSSSFQLLTDSADAEQALQRFRDHLEPAHRVEIPEGSDLSAIDTSVLDTYRLGTSGVDFSEPGAEPATAALDSDPLSGGETGPGRNNWA